MRILVSWLRELVPVTVSVDELADALTAHGFEVSAVEPAPIVPGRPPRGEDAVLDLEITTNRPDCLSVAGIAREVSTIYGDPLTWPESSDTPTGNDALPVTIEKDALALCPRYAASVAEVSVRPSPAWMAARLEAAGVRPINNVVDVTNYVMLELGHPLHAFDLDRLAGGELRIRCARAGETVRTLDGVERKLAGDMLVIADGRLPQAVAGVMGGADAEVTDGTVRVAFESAWFDPVSVRRTSKRLALSTDASFRFERGADIEAPVRAMRRALRLLGEIGGGAPHGSIVDRYPTPRDQATVTLRHARIGHVLGIEVEPAFVPVTLQRLGFGVGPASDERDGRRWQVMVPPHRVDVSREIDLIEEIARHHGYERLPSTFPALVRPPAPPSAALSRQRLLRRVLTAGGCSEAITYGFIEEAAARPFVDRSDELVRIANPLSEKFAVLRPSLVPGLLDALIHNRRREHRDIRLFEIGHRFTAAEGETSGFAVALTGASIPRHWGGGERQADLYDMIGLVDRVCDAFGVTPVYEPAAPRTLVPGCAAAVQATPRDGEREQLTLGYVGELAPSIAQARGLPADDAIFVAELDLAGIARTGTDRRRMVAAPLPRYPSVVRDLAVIVDATLPAATVRDTIRSVAPDTLRQVREFDLYKGKGIPSGRMSLALRLTFRAADRTLTDAEVQQAMDAIVATLETRHEATLR